jgi:trigger factor
MQTTLETLGPLERRLHVAVPVADVEGEVQKRLARLAKTIKIAGFRPGKVPLKMVAQQYGPQVRTDVITEQVQNGFNDAVRAQNLRVAGMPRIEPSQSQAAQSEALEFAAVFEVYPDVRIGDLSKATIRRPRAEVTPADIDHTIDVLRRQRTTFAPVDRAAQAGDRVKVDFTGTIDGVEFPGGQAQDFPIMLGEARMLPEFESALPGMRAGEQKSFEVKFPDDYHGREVAGKNARFELTVKAVEEPQLPALDESFAKGFGIASGNVDDLRAEVEQNLRLELKRKIEATTKDQALKALRENAELALPKSLVEAETHALMQRMSANLRDQGMKPEDIKLSPDLFRSQAEERVALALIIGELVQRESLQAKPEQVKASVQELAQTYEQPEAVVRWHYEKPERLKDFEALVVEQNVVDWVLGRAQVEDAQASFASIMEPPPQR